MDADTSSDALFSAGPASVSRTHRVPLDIWMVDLKDLSVDASQGVDRAKLVFDREGILVAKNLLPAEVVRTAADFLRDAVTEIDRTVRQYGFSLQDADAGERLTALMETPQAEISEHDRHMFLGHFPLDVRLAEPLRTIPRFLNSHPLLFDLLSHSGSMPTCRRQRVMCCRAARWRACRCTRTSATIGTWAISASSGCRWCRSIWRAVAWPPTREPTTHRRW